MVRPARRRRPVSSEDDQGTRRKVIDAAIRCILEQGFYRASSNAIAEAAGLSWGVIQYYFGSREALMLAVLDEGSQRLADAVSNAKIDADTVAGRLLQYSDIIHRYYGDSDYLAFEQVLLNLSQDPTTSEQTRESMAKSSEAIKVEFQRLTDQLFAGTDIEGDSVIRGFPFHALRGMALSELMLQTLPFNDINESEVLERRRLLTEAVASMIEATGSPA